VAILSKISEFSTATVYSSNFSNFKANVSQFNWTFFEILAWKPVKPNVTHPTWSSATVSFKKPTDYDIKKFTFHLAKHEYLKEGTLIFTDTVKMMNVTASDVRTLF